MLAEKTIFSQNMPCLTCVMDHRSRLGPVKAIMPIKARSVITEVNSSLCGTWPFFLAFSSFFGVGCSVLSAAGFSGISYNLVLRTAYIVLRSRDAQHTQISIGQQFAHPVGELSNESVDKRQKNHYHQQSQTYTQRQADEQNVHLGDYAGQYCQHHHQ